MLPAAPTFSNVQQQNQGHGFPSSVNPLRNPVGPSTFTGYTPFSVSLSQPLPSVSSLNQSQDLLEQNADPNSPEVFKHNLRVVHQQAVELQNMAKRVLMSIQHAYQVGNSPAQTEASISTLKQLLSLVIEKMRQSGVGALPIIPLDKSRFPNPNVALPIPSEKDLMESTTKSLQALYEKLQTSQDGAAIVANLLAIDHASAPVAKK